MPDELPAPPRFPELMDAPLVPMVIEVESEATSDFEEEQEQFWNMISMHVDLAFHEEEATEAHANAVWEEMVDAPELLDGITTATPPCPPRLQSPKRPPARQKARPKAEEKKAPKPPATPPPQAKAEEKKPKPR